MKKNVVNVVKGVVSAYILSAVFLVVLAFLMFQWDVSENVVRGGIIFTYVFSCFISGMIVSRQHEGRRYLWGILMGAMYYLILFITSMIFSRGAFSEISGILPALFLCVFGGMFGGMAQAGRKG